jgi:hypothetical protein
MPLHGDHLERFCEKRSCVGRSKGCDFVGTSRDLEGHQCPFQVIPCPNGCAFRVERVSRHIESKCAVVKNRQATKLQMQNLINALNPSVNDMIPINAGGYVCRVVRSTLTKYPESVLGLMFGDDQHKVNLDEHGHCLINIPGDCFQPLLKWLQYGILCVEELGETDRQILLTQARELRLPELEVLLTRKARLTLTSPADGQFEGELESSLCRNGSLGS